jgi:hypothetical protein
MYDEDQAESDHQTVSYNFFERHIFTVYHFLIRKPCCGFGRFRLLSRVYGAEGHSTITQRGGSGQEIVIVRP